MGWLLDWIDMLFDTKNRTVTRADRRNLFVAAFILIGFIALLFGLVSWLR